MRFHPALLWRFFVISAPWYKWLYLLTYLLPTPHASYSNPKPTATSFLLPRLMLFLSVSSGKADQWTSLAQSTGSGLVAVLWFMHWDLNVTFRSHATAAAARLLSCVPLDRTASAIDDHCLCHIRHRFVSQSPSRRHVTVILIDLSWLSPSSIPQRAAWAAHSNCPAALFGNYHF